MLAREISVGAFFAVVLPLFASAVGGWLLLALSRPGTVGGIGRGTDEGTSQGTEGGMDGGADRGTNGGADQGDPPGGGTGGTDAYTDLRQPFLWMCGVFSLTAVGVAGAEAMGRDVSGVSFVIFAAFAVPWTVFAIQYVGRGHLLTRRRITGGLVPIGFVTLVFLAETAELAQRSSETGRFLSLLASVIVLGILAVVFAVGGLVLVSAYRHRTLSLAHGGVVVFPMAAILVAIQLTRPETPVLNDVVYGTLFTLVAGALVLAPRRYDVLTTRPGTATIGERAAVQGLDEAVVTVGREGTVARANRAALELFGPDLDETGLADQLGTGIETLANRATVECWTERGRRQFDPRIIELTNDYDEIVGYTVTLIDITDREIRRQRIEVLNRILRHNIRNSLDVIKADAELLADDTRAASILETTETLERLSGDARRIEKLLGRSQGDSATTDLSRLLDSVVESVAEAHPTAEIVSEFGARAITVDDGLCRFALRNVIENAVVHNEGTAHVDVRATDTDTGVEVVVADDGPGIPEAERSVIESRTESPQSHASSLGLWGTNWAVQQLGGELTFTESERGGTAVTITLPDG